MARRSPALTQRLMERAVDSLVRRDSDLAEIVARCGRPDLFRRPPGFASLVYIILEQQVSLASARASYEKLAARLPRFLPREYLALSDADLRSAGVSRQKARYTRLVARAILDGHLPIEGLGRLSDDRVRALLTAITGIGDWTADIYMMSALRRPDLWPVGDLALVKSVHAVKGLAERPDRERLEALGEAYRPYRSVATQIFWRHYLHKE